jgi:hypothetical protein
LFFHHVQHTKTFVSATIAIAKQVGLFFQFEDGNDVLYATALEAQQSFRMRSRRKVSYAETISTVSRELINAVKRFTGFTAAFA